MDVVRTNGESTALTLVLGGTRSGKSEVAERLIDRLAGPDGTVTYVATAPGAAAGPAGPISPAAGGALADTPAITGPRPDPAWTARIEAHRRRRPARWLTVELGPGDDLGAAIRGVEGPALVDSLGTWVAGFAGFVCDADGLCADLAARAAEPGRPTVIVSDEVGLGVHPPTEAGVAFADALGSLNRQVASVAGTVLLVVAGRALTLQDAGG